MMPDHSAAFIRFAAERKRVRGSRGEVVALARWYLPMLGREHSEQLPPLRTRLDVRRWAGDGHSHGFRCEAERLWIEFTRSLDPAARKVARSLDDPLRDARTIEWKRAFVKTWARTFGRRIVSAAQLSKAYATSEAIRIAGADVSPVSIGIRVERLVGAPLGIMWTVERAPADTHSKVKRWRLEPLPDDEERPDPWL